MSMSIASAFQDLHDTATYGGALEKAKFLCYPGTPENYLAGEPKEIVFFLNPSSIHMEKEVQFAQQPTTQTATGIFYSHTDPICLTIGELWFDTYDTRKSVREEYIDELESLADYDPDTHYPRTIVFHFGVFSARTKHQVVYTFFLSKLSVDYTMFLCDGTPVRAKVSVSLKQLMTPRLEQEVRPKQSPDHARVYTVKRGDTLQRISTFAYGSPSEWRRIADSNHLDDPMSLRPGAKLVLPPILR